MTFIATSKLLLQCLFIGTGSTGVGQCCHLPSIWQIPASREINLLNLIPGPTKQRLCILHLCEIEYFIVKMTIRSLFTKLRQVTKRQQRDLSVFESSCHLLCHCVKRMVEIFNVVCQARKLGIPNFRVFGLTREGIKPEFTVSVADSLSS